MLSRRPFASSFILALACSAAACSTPPVKTDLPLTPVAGAARPAIEAALKRYNRFMRAGPPDSAAAMFTEDGELYEPRDAVQKGRTAIRAFLEPLSKGVRIESAASTTQALEVWGKTALQWGEYVENAGPAGLTPTGYRGRFVAEWEHQSDGRWLLHRMMVQPLGNR